MWTWCTGLGIAAASGHESVPIRWAWVSGNPAGMSQRRSGGLESAAIRRALSQRRAGGHWVRGDPVVWSPANWGSGNPGTRQPAGGLGRATAGGRYLPRSAGMRARGQRTRGTRGDPAELPRRPAVGYCARTSGDFLATGQTDTGTNQRLFRTKKQNGVNGRRLRLGLVFCHGAHTREEQGHADEDVNSNNNI